MDAPESRTTVDAVRAPPSRASWSAFFSYGFRPFFLLAAGWAAFALLTLLGGVASGAWPGDALPLVRWHAHEMLFGFVAASIAGFLLTAVPTWTGSRPISGWALAALAVLWLAGRTAMSPWLGMQGTPWLLLDAAFFPALAVVLAVPLLRTRNYRNLQFLFILTLLTGADALFVSTQLGWFAPAPFDPLRFSVNLILLMITVVGGRIIPAFTRNALLKSGMRCTFTPLVWLDRASLAAVAAVVVADIARPDSAFAGWLAALAAALLAARASRWHGHRTLRMPIVWILHAGFAWLYVALALKAVWLLGHASFAAHWLHALTAGAFGTMTLAVMTRVALGHTGRELVVARPIAAAYVLVIAGAALRVVGPAALSAHYVQVLAAAGVLWAAAFVIFLTVYVPILVAPRIDDQVPSSA
ncbi:MAG TPA: NnrS family protein [Gammaproteobacteria bacterium]|nr:NnrS family protein [Gammaproteobacteria bacterium]